MNEQIYDLTMLRENDNAPDGEHKKVSRRAMLRQRLGLQSMKDDASEIPKKQRTDILIVHKGARLYPLEHFDVLVERREELRSMLSQWCD